MTNSYCVRCGEDFELPGELRTEYGRAIVCIKCKREEEKRMEAKKKDNEAFEKSALSCRECGRELSTVKYAAGSGTCLRCRQDNAREKRFRYHSFDQLISEFKESAVEDFLYERGELIHVGDPANRTKTRDIEEELSRRVNK